MGVTDTELASFKLQSYEFPGRSSYKPNAVSVLGIMVRVVGGGYDPVESALWM